VLVVYAAVQAYNTTAHSVLTSMYTLLFLLLFPCSSYPALLHYAYKYADNPEAALLASTNAGGENVARGSLLGALLGAAHGATAFPQRFVNGLHESVNKQAEIDSFLNVTAASSQ
jgi:ADP-ribosylglycohydrolase